MKTIIHVNQHNIKHNSKSIHVKKPVLSIKTYKETLFGNEVEIDGPSKIIYSPDKPLSCGAKVWIETHAKVVVKD